MVSGLLPVLVKVSEAVPKPTYLLLCGSDRSAARIAVHSWQEFGVCGAIGGQLGAVFVRSAVRSNVCGTVRNGLRRYFFGCRWPVSKKCAISLFSPIVGAGL